MKSDLWSGKRVFITGHTGFKGTWLALWLAQLGAKVSGYSLSPSTRPSIFELAMVSDIMEYHTIGDIRDLQKLRQAIGDATPDIVFHLAAQPLVRASYREPVETWSTNVMGTVHLLEAARHTPSVQAIVVITTDKCYKNNEWLWGYRESDRLGGYDPYSSSKAGAELVVDSYRKSFFSEGMPLIASARAGNVIGGGDWSEDRLIPDAYRAFSAGEPLIIRNPNATRPWQHVLSSLHGYLLLAEKLLNGEREFAGPFNFGPDAAGNVSVRDIMTKLQTYWPELIWELDQQQVRNESLHEAGFLYLDSSKACRLLNWLPRWSLEESLSETAQWYKAVHSNPQNARAFSELQIDRFNSCL